MRKISYDEIEKTLGGAKFAVVIISIFTLVMIIATFVESRLGSDFTNRLIYKSPTFIVLQALLFLSFVFSILRRTPFKMRLLGFYIIHFGLILIATGSYLTYEAGIDGSLSLNPNVPNNKISLESDVLLLSDSKGKQKIFKLPYSPYSQTIDKNFSGIKIKKYIPFAKNGVTWKKTDKKLEESHSAIYKLSSDKHSTTFPFSIHPEADAFNPNIQYKSYNLLYLPTSFLKCLLRNKKSNFIIYNKITFKCFDPIDLKIKITKSKLGNDTFIYKGKSFFPGFSHLPINNHYQQDINSDIFVFNTEEFKSQKTLILMGKTIAYYSSKGSLKTVALEINKPLFLDTLNYKIELLNFEEKMIPTFSWKYALPQNDQSIKALLINHNGEDFWITNMSPIKINIKGNETLMQLDRDIYTLPFSVVLEKFQMKKNPGTNTPASFESFIKIIDNDLTKKDHLSMNNPSKHKKFTLYQSSYFEQVKGVFGSVLSVNVDPGRFFKYLGSLLLVLGAIVYYARKRPNSIKE